MSSPRTARRLVLAVVATSVLLLALGACGSDAGSSSAPATTTADGGGGDGADGGFVPFTVEHRYGSTEIEEQPQRIVSLDTQWTDVLTALGTTPVGYLADQVEGVLPWQEGLDDSTPLTGGTAIPFEEIAGLRPDLIVVTYNLSSETDYGLLSEIAPTIATLNPDGAVDTWQSIAEVAGQVIGDPAAADDLVADVDGQVTAVADANPGLDGATFAFANYVSGDAIYVLVDPDDGANVLFTQLGMVIPDHLLGLPADTGRAKLSLEQLDLLDSQLLMMLAQGSDPATIPGYAQLPAVEAGTAQIMDYALAVALNTPTPLSVPYALEQVEPVLVAVGA